MAGRQDLP